MTEHEPDAEADHDGNPSLDWEQVALGERSLAEVEAARRAAGESDEQLTRDRALFRPFDELEHEQLVAGLREGLTRARAAEATEAQPEPTPEPVELAPRRRTVATIAAVGLSAAAAVALWFLWPRGPKDPEPEQMIAVKLEIGGTLDTSWSSAKPNEPAPVHRFASTASFVWIMRPELEVGFEPEVRAFVIDPERRREIDQSKLETTTDPRTGAVKITGPIAALGLEPGETTIVLVYGPKGRINVDADAAAALEDGPDLQVERATLELVPAG